MAEQERLCVGGWGVDGRATRHGRAGGACPLGVPPAPAHARFAEAGWSYEEPVARPCPSCAGPLSSLRKPYVTAGKPYRYVARVCPACPASFALT